jgi:hypothetical protein
MKNVIVTVTKLLVSCRPLFKHLEILPLQFQYILFLLVFVVKNEESFTNNQEICNINTRYNSNMHPPLCNLALFQKGTYYTGIKLFNNLPIQIKRLTNGIKLFKLAVKELLIFHSFYTLEEYFETNFNRERISIQGKLKHITICTT